MTQNSNKTNNHKLLITAFIVVDLVLIGLITLAFGGFSPVSIDQSFAANDVNDLSSISQTNSEIPITVNSLITVNSTPTITGTAPKDSTVVVRTTNDVQILMSDSNGNWKFTPSLAYSIGVYDIRVEALDSNGQVLGVDSTMDELEIIASQPVSSSASTLSNATSTSVFESLGNPDPIPVVYANNTNSNSQSSSMGMNDTNSSTSSSMSPDYTVIKSVTSSSPSSSTNSNTSSSSMTSISSTSSKTTSSSSPASSSSTNSNASKTSSSPVSSPTSLMSSSTNNLEMNTARTGGIDSLKIASLIIFMVFNVAFFKLKNTKIQNINLK